MKILIITLAVLISGCGDFTRNYLIGDELPPGDIQSQRIAMKTIKVFDDLPDNAQSVKEIFAARCHREEFEKEPKEEMLIGDFKIQAVWTKKSFNSDKMSLRPEECPRCI